ncbi:MAG: four helix bundle protein [Bacteroidales bacterium]|nr:four helix bundle protein [Bacteroidales bacterium]
MKNSIVGGKTFLFALNILGLYKELINRKEYVISRQLLRSSTSIGANIEEASAALSKKDFIAKMSITSKEAREARYWLRLLQASNFINGITYNDLITEVTEVINMLTKIVKTSQQNLKE